MRAALRCIKHACYLWGFGETNAMNTVAILLSAFVLSFVALLVFIASQRSGLFDRRSRAAEVIFAPGVISLPSRFEYCVGFSPALDECVFDRTLHASGKQFERVLGGAALKQVDFHFENVVEDALPLRSWQPLRDKQLAEEGITTYDMGPLMDYKVHWTETQTAMEVLLLRPRRAGPAPDPRRTAG